MGGEEVDKEVSALQKSFLHSLFVPLRSRIVQLLNQGRCCKELNPSQKLVKLWLLNSSSPFRCKRIRVLGFQVGLLQFGAFVQHLVAP